MDEEKVRANLTILVGSFEKLKGQIKRCRTERNEIRKKLEKRAEECSQLETKLAAAEEANKGLRSEVKRLLKLDRIHNLEHRSNRSSPTRHLTTPSASLELKVLSMLQSTRKRITEYRDSAPVMDKEPLKDLRVSMSPSPTRKFFTIESLASSNPEDLVEKDEVIELEGSVEDEINRSILGLEGMSENSMTEESEDSVNYVLQSLGNLMQEKKLDASRLVFEEVDKIALVIE